MVRFTDLDIYKIGAIESNKGEAGMTRTNEESRLPTLATERLLLRPWRDSDAHSFAALNADPEVMAFLRHPSSGSSASGLINARRMIARNAALSRDRGFGHWALEAVGVAPFIGVAGLAVPPFRVSITPCVMIAWRLARAYWGCGYATEAGRAVLTFAFEEMGLEEVVAFTVPANQRSLAVMDRLGMTRSPEEDFDMPDLPEGHPLRRQIFYRLRRTLFNAQRQ